MKNQNGVSELGTAILGIGMITGLHAAISPSIFTFNCFAKKEAEKAIGRKTLWISLGATTVTSVGLHLVFGKWIPTIVAEITALGLFGLGMYAISCADSAPDAPTMETPPAALPASNQMTGLRRPEMHYGVIRGMGRLQPDVLKVA
jgi:hypothetical protein